MKRKWIYILIILAVIPLGFQTYNALKPPPFLRLVVDSLYVKKFINLSPYNRTGTAQSGDLWYYSNFLTTKSTADENISGEICDTVTLGQGDSVFVSKTFTGSYAGTCSWLGGYEGNGTVEVAIYSNGYSIGSRTIQSLANRKAVAMIKKTTN